MLPSRILALACLALLASGCTGAMTSSSTTSAAPGAPFTPPAAPEPAATTNGTVLAALLNQTSGGIAAWESGVSGIILFSDGTVLRLQGMEWGPRERTGSCPATVQAALDHAAAWLGGNGTVDCGLQRVQASQMGRMDAASLARVQDVLNAHKRLNVPPARQETHCCDMVATGRHLWFGDFQTFFVDEQEQGGPAPVSQEVDGFVAQLDALGAWVTTG